jgi:hypothetical protein
LKNRELYQLDIKGTTWGGMQEMKMLIEKTGISKKIEELGLPEKMSNNSIAGISSMKVFG